MFGCDADITIWRRAKDRFTRKDLFKRVDVPVKCRWKKQSGRDIYGANGGSGAVMSDNVVVVMPYYAGLDNDLICPGDIIALGKYDTLEEAEEKAGKAGNVITVSRISYNFDSENFNTMRGKHLRIEGK